MRTLARAALSWRPSASGWREGVSRGPEQHLDRAGVLLVEDRVTLWRFAERHRVRDDPRGPELAALHERQQRRHVVARVADAHPEAEVLEEGLAGREAQARLDVDADRGDRPARAHRLDRLGERGLVADALEHHVGPPAARQAAKLLGGAAAGQVAGLGAEP